MNYFIWSLFIFLIPATVFGQPSQKSGYFNPDISVIMDGVYQSSSPRHNIGSIIQGIPGFPCPGSEADLEEGFNARESELVLSSVIDPYFTGYLVASLQNEGAGIEEAIIQTTALPYGLEVKAGKLFSNFGRINSQHGHAWDFIDRPLIYQLTLGEEGLNNNGVQVSYLAPTSFYLLAGLEAFQGDNPQMFGYYGEAPLPARTGPRALIGWLKTAPELSAQSEMQFGVSFGQGMHQAILDSNNDGTDDNWLSGDSQFWGLDCVYKYDALKAYGEGKWTIQGEYFSRKQDLVVKEDDITGLTSEHQVNYQDGYYLQATYGFLPGWQAGLRWEQVGLINKVKEPNGSTNSFDPSQRESLALTRRLSEFSYLRLQFANGKYQTATGPENISQVFLQIQVSLGKHGAHKF
ncbi:MAG TPA: hypothetical protein VJC37_08670 [Planctomycetota bacterium]|nr:hypothetical protein [Planctomycetota bacterium]